MTLIAFGTFLAEGVDSYMSRPLDEIKAQIAKEYQATQRFEPEGWLARYPEWRAELTEFFAVFGPALSAAEGVPVPRWRDPSGTLRRIQENTRRIAAIRAADLAETQLGSAIADVDAPAVVIPPKGSNRWMEAKTAIFTWIVDTFRRARRGNTGRYDANKATYLTERAFGLDLFRGFRPAQLGMWNPVLETVETEATGRGWIKSVEKGRRFAAGPNLDEGLRLARERLSDPQLANQFARHLVANRDYLELWGMVDHSALQLANSGRRISATAIRDVIMSVPEWEEKTHLLPGIPSALEHLIRLELIPTELIDFEEPPS